MTKYQICDRAHVIEVAPCALCHKDVDLSQEHYVQLEAARSSLHTECALAAVIAGEANL